MRAAQQHTRVAHQVLKLLLPSIAKLQRHESNTAACHVSFTCIGQESCKAHATRRPRTVRSADVQKTSDAEQNNGCRFTDELSQP